MSVADLEADLERRFSALKRLYGVDGYARIRDASVCIVGLGGVGSWAAEALARCGVRSLTLIDFDHIAESNINRQVHALSGTLGLSKVAALQERIAQIHPGCAVHAVDAFVTPDEWPALLPAPVNVVIDACDDARAKLTLARWALSGGHKLVMVGAAGGKRQAQWVEIADLVAVTHDPLLAQLRQRLRREGILPSASGKPRPVGLACVFSREAVLRPAQVSAQADPQADRHTDTTCALDPQATPFQPDLNCHGYGSVVTVTACFGLVAADAALHLLTS